MTDIKTKTPTIRLFHVRKRYGAKAALLDVTLDIFKNEFLFIHGPSGAGKTTLLKLLYLGEHVSEGQILIDGMNLARISAKRVHMLRRKFGIIFQDFKLIPTKTVFENVALVLEAAGKPNRAIQKKVRSVLRAVGMEEKANSFPPTLSGGEQQRVAIARAVAGDPKIILADEPTGSLDPDSAASIMELLKGFHTRGATVLLATHNKELASKMASRTIYLNQGTLEITHPS
ncbi:MAG: cell division ATP-binding protein FtsE [Deltaproteobacteria bacterium]|nr:cell division ATP-binding protein FtsE [Deltaproteobacteria bacterium]MBW2181491.1 cell division ATP-binding protein FtsE [Deltaproteobacteria bacterium]MBW2366004.1 cell division ATP-binding protein FtsE [Deltaproteobacteria bacterium]